MKIILFVLFVSFAACKGKPAPAPTPAAKAGDTTKFFQVKEYIEGQINAVNKTPYFIYKIDVIDTRKDSVVIDNQQFSEIAKQFLQPDINDASLRPFYTENVFNDQTTKTYTLNYSTTNKDLPVQSIDVLLNENPQTVKRIFIRRFYNYGDSSAIEQLSWKPDESFQVNRLVQFGEEKEKSHQTTVVWNEGGNKKP